MSQFSTRVRAPVVRILDHATAMTIIGTRSTVRFDGDHAELVRAVLEIHTTPTTRDQLLTLLGERSGGAVPVEPVDAVVAMLEREGVLVARLPSPHQPPHATSGTSPRRVVLAISGAVAAADAPAVVRRLHAAGYEVRIALTEAAQRFVAVAALEAITHHQVWRGLWQCDAATPVPHLALAEWAELVVVWPASATTIARIARGDCSDLVSAVVTATRAPVAIAPSMNLAMLGSPAVRDNLAAIRRHGRAILHPGFGSELADPVGDRQPTMGAAVPASALIDMLPHLLPRVSPPITADDWERVWSRPGPLPWRRDQLATPVAEALDRLAADHPDAHMLELGTGDGIVAREAARRGLRVTATDISAEALRHARQRDAGLPILWVLDDATASQLGGEYDIVVDVGLWHCLPRDRWERYSELITRRTRHGGTLLVVAHQPSDRPVYATTPVTAADLATHLPSFTVTAASPCELAGVAAQLFELSATG